MFGLLNLETKMHGTHFAIGLRNGHDNGYYQAIACVGPTVVSLIEMVASP